MGLPHHTYFEDAWVLTIEKLSLSKRSYQRKKELCEIILYPNDEDIDSWEWSCGYLADVNSSTPCRWEDVMKKAWCLDQYQTFTSPL